jgi:crotonobetainyl-CoA:carnitine CoA-transferase CaiB-like acyl-CoA transferase
MEVKGMTSESQPYSGIRILDLGNEMGAYCGKLLGDLGADVIKVEKPGGDDTRKNGPFFEDDPHPEKSLFFGYNNTGKRSITLNLETRDGQAIFKSLAKTADAIIETFPIGKMDSLGLGFENLRAVNHGIIMASITPFGQTGPHKDWESSSELIPGAMSGVLYLTGDGKRTPLQIGNFLFSHGAGAYAAIGIAAALHGRHFTGDGEHIDISVQDCAASWLDMTWGNYQNAGIIQERYGSQGYMRIPANIYPCKDGYFFIIGIAMWDRIVNWLIDDGIDVGDFADEKYMGFKGAKLLWEQLPKVNEMIIALGKNHTKAEMMAIGQKRRVPVTMVVNARDVYEDPHLAERGYYVEVDHPYMGKHKYPGAPYKFSEPLWKSDSPAPCVGQHNEEIYQELGFTKAHLNILKMGGTI